ncbi:hypothetical protein DNTS_013077 [Danionella cerebrum]|uniref:Uncharacterized protein n=1 Tax=Danionella cerebrum TaxID=2873325 RepID=A0A553QV97_9TELE|nr:hypothetical protein DNTS_013077 [Danionella translucida]
MLALYLSSAHDRSETVLVTLCQARPGGSVAPMAEERFQFVQDLALDMAQFLVSAAGRTEGALLLDECQIPLTECERLDETLALALRHLPLPDGWSVLGTHLDVWIQTIAQRGLIHSEQLTRQQIPGCHVTQACPLQYPQSGPMYEALADTELDNQTLVFVSPPTEPGPHDTLLHFAARRGLRKVALFLLQQPGGKEALRLPNKQGRTPARVAKKRGHSQLQKLFSE